MFNTIILYTQVAQDAEQILKHAERVLRWNWNLYGFQRLGSGYEVVTTDGFGNPYVSSSCSALPLRCLSTWTTARQWLSCGAATAW